MTSFGIDQISFYSSHYVLPLDELAQARGLHTEYFQQRLGQKMMAVSPPSEDIVTLAANAAKQILLHNPKGDIELLLVATESSVDQSKAAALYVHTLLDLPSRCRSLELKQACYSGTAGLQLAMHWLAANPQKKALLICTDIAHYALHSDAEASQGAAAVAMLLSKDPRLLAVEPGSGIYSQSVQDFWRPNYSDTAFVDGRLSCESYIKALGKTWKDYQQHTQRSFDDHHHFCFHTPFPKLVCTAMQKLARQQNRTRLASQQIEDYLGYSLDYNRLIGNCYSASLGLSFTSLLENNPADLTGKRIGAFSYGSGLCAEYFSLQVQPGYQNALYTHEHRKLLNQRKKIQVAKYQDFHNFNLTTSGQYQAIPQHPCGAFSLQSINQHQRHYGATMSGAEQNTHTQCDVNSIRNPTLPSEQQHA